MRLHAAGFDWDAGNSGKCRKHGVSLAEIEAMFSGDDVRVAPDPAHSQHEDRLIAVGRTLQGRPLFVAFTFRRVAGRLLVRPVSARYMHEREIARYEEETRSDENPEAADG